MQIATFGSENVNYNDLDQVKIKGFNLSDYDNPLVKRQIDLYRRPSSIQSLQTVLDRSAIYLPTIRRIFREKGIPEDLAYLPVIESSFIVNARSKKSAVGIWQFTKGTGLFYKLSGSYWHDDRQDVVKSTYAAAYHLRYLFKMFDDWLLVLAAYNTGEGRLLKIMKKENSRSYWTLLERKALPKETADYVPKFIAATFIIKNKEHFGLHLQERTEFENLKPFEVSDATDLKVLAENAHLSYDEIKSYNPSLSQWMTPPSQKYTVYLPLENHSILSENWKKIPPSDHITYRRYFVNVGDNLTRISQKFKIPENPIVSINKIKSRNQIQAGKYIYLPIRGLNNAKEIDVANTDSTKKEGSHHYSEVFFHEVKDGDSLYTLALKYGVSLTDLMRWNDLSGYQYVRNGMLLIIKR